jgi:hypothetical protein
LQRRWLLSKLPKRQERRQRKKLLGSKLKKRQQKQH